MSIAEVTEDCRRCSVCGGRFNRRRISDDPTRAQVQQDYTLCDECAFDHPEVARALLEAEERWSREPVLPSWWRSLFYPALDRAVLSVLRGRRAQEWKNSERDDRRDDFLLERKR